MMKDLAIPIGVTGGTVDECFFYDVVLIIADGTLLCTPPAFILKKAVVGWLRSSETETLITLSGIPLYRFPHDQVVCSQMPIMLIRCAIFVERLFPKVKKERAGNISVRVGR